MAKKKVLEKIHIKTEVTPVPTTGVKDPMDDVIVSIPIRMKIAKQLLHPGENKVKRHQLESISEIVNKKIQADMSITTGKSYLIKHLKGVGLQVKEVAQLNFK